jgi:hypothetical protein
MTWFANGRYWWADHPIVAAWDGADATGGATTTAIPIPVRICIPLCVRLSLGIPGSHFSPPQCEAVHTWRQMFAGPRA